MTQPSRRLKAALAPARSRLKAREADDWAEKERQLIADCHPKQRDFVLDPGRRVCALVGRGGGKTTGILVRLTRRMKRTPRARCLYVATTRDQAIELLWNPLKELVEKLGIAATFNETALRCTFTRNKSTLRLVGADDKRQIEKYRGQPFHEVWIDEAASYPVQLLEHLVERIISPRLGDYGGMLGMVGTPSHQLAGLFYDATRPGSENHRRYEDRDNPEVEDAEWSFHSWTLLDGAPYVPALQRLWDEAVVEKTEKKWSDSHPVWMREYLGRWAADSTLHVFHYRPHDDEGRPFNQWNPARHERTGLAVMPKELTGWRFVYGMDLGFSDPFALEVVSWSPADTLRRLFHVYEFVRRGMFAKSIAEVLAGAEYVAAILAGHPPPPFGGVIGATGWPDAMVADVAGLGEGILKELSEVYGLRITAAARGAGEKFGAIELGNGDLVEGRALILKGSILEQQMIDNQWSQDDFGQLKRNRGQRDDAADGWVYARQAAHHLMAESGTVTPPPRLSEYQRAGREREALYEKPRGEFDGLLDDGGYYDEAEAWG